MKKRSRIKKFVALLSGLILCAISITSYAKMAQQTIIFQLPPGWVSWHLIDQSENDEGTSFTFAPSGESLHNWKQSIRTVLIPYTNMQGISAKKYMKLQIEDARRQCQHVDSKILSQTGRSITYTIDIENCASGETQKQIAKGFNGTEGVHNITYSAVLGETTERDYQTISTMIKRSHLGKNPAAE